MSKYESFIAFESVVRIKNEAEFIKFCDLMKQLGLKSIEYLKRQGFHTLHKNYGCQVIPYGELCFEYQVYKHFTIGKEQDYIDYGCEILSLDELISDLED